jgi:hypothetical protein
MFLRVKIKDETRKARQKIIDGSVKSLGKAGAYIRGIAKKSIKTSQRISEPGRPPHTRQGRLKHSIYFAVEKQTPGVVIGPVASAVGKIAHTHEFGGTEPPKLPPALRENNWELRLGGHGPLRVVGDTVYVGRLNTPAQVEHAKKLAPEAIDASYVRYLDALMAHWTTGRSKVRKYPARPFMGPALEVSKERLPKFWANSVKGG